MHPAPSIIIFTVASGIGFGLMALLGLGFGTSSTGFAWVASIVAGAFACGGLVSSTFHLGHPERAIKAFSQWRSSWVSREGVLAVALLLVYGIYFLLWAFLGQRVFIIGLLVALLAIGAVIATSMIYAQLKTVPKWNTLWTCVVYVCASAAGGMLMLVALDALFGAYSATNALLAFIFMALTAIAYLIYKAKTVNKGLSSGGTPESATGLGFMGKVSLLESPHSAPNYLLTEMVYQVGRNKANALGKLVLLLAFGLPLLLLLMVLFTGWAWLSLIAVLCHITGMLASRWLFFAEAEHVVALYYGHR